MSPTPYLIMKTIHLASVVVFLGNILLGMFWKAHGDRSKDARTIAHTLEGIIRADRMFTMPAVTLLLIAGFGAQGMGGYPITLPWILWSLILVVVSTLAFMGFVVPAQKKMLALAKSSSMDWARYEALSRQWNLWGIIATIAPIIAFVLMILKPR